MVTQDKFLTERIENFMQVEMFTSYNGKCALFIIRGPDASSFALFYF